MRRFVKYTVAGLVLIIVAMGSMLITMRLAIHRREVIVPKFIGLLPQPAYELARQNGLILVRESRFYSDDIPVGHIVSQEPSPGQKVRKGWRVRIAESMGPQRNVVPSVIGDSPRAAELNISQRGLELGTISTMAVPDTPPNQVIAQSPPPDSHAASPKVNILVSAPADDKAYVMPDLTGMRLSDATAAITNAGLKPQAPSAATPDAIVVKQTPAVGQRVTSGATVTLGTGTPPQS
ncbi:MAG: PASTA domain-containing protein [Terriglobia bacterium]|jgi:beta-lactam-binding protein with PASTA domain|nr:PASTA domain-containing protein [Terriglobia bacterium]